MIQEQAERIIAIAETVGNIKGFDHLIAQIDTRQPTMIPLLASVEPREWSAQSQDTVITWDLFLYLKEYNLGLTLVNNVNVYLFIEQFLTAFISRPKLQLNGSNLANVRTSNFGLTSALSSPITYPPRSRGQIYWGVQARLTVYTTSFISLNIKGD